MAFTPRTSSRLPLRQGADLWNALIKRCPKFFWRARPENSVNVWYFRHCDGVRKFGRWYVYWVGLNEKEIRQAVRYCLRLAETLTPFPPKPAAKAP